MTDVYLAGVGISEFGKWHDPGLRVGSMLAIRRAFSDSGVSPHEVQRIYFANAAGGVITQQEMIRGQVALRGTELSAKPIINIENACASGSSAFFLAYEAIKAGQAEMVLVVGVEKMHVADKRRTFKALWGSSDTIEHGEFPPGDARSSVLMGFYAEVAQRYLVEYGAERSDFARVAVKNRKHAALNPIAQFKSLQTIDDVLNAPMIADPLTLPMCAPLTDGAAAILVCSARYAARLASGDLVKVNACSLASSPGPGESPVTPACDAAYEASGLGPTDFDLIELHDAAAPAELLQYSEIGLCNAGEGHLLVRKGYTDLSGDMPVNTSGGLLSRGHALGATGCAQLVELYQQLTGRAGKREVQGARLAMAVNGGGWLAGTYAVAVTTICEKMSRIPGN